MAAVDRTRRPGSGRRPPGHRSGRPTTTAGPGGCSCSSRRCWSRGRTVWPTVTTWRWTCRPKAGRARSGSRPRRRKAGTDRRAHRRTATASPPHRYRHDESDPSDSLPFRYVAAARADGLRAVAVRTERRGRSADGRAANEAPRRRGGREPGRCGPWDMVQAGTGGRGSRAGRSSGQGRPRKAPARLPRGRARRGGWGVGGCGRRGGDHGAVRAYARARELTALARTGLAI